MQTFEDDDDTHFCNKCHSTINGLDNYVRHRQSDCRTAGGDKTEVYHCPPATPRVSYPEILNADAFFSSLELQSSSKPQPRRNADLLNAGPRRSARKRRRKDKSPDEKEETKPSKLANLLPVDTDLDDLGIPSLVGFPEIVATTSASTSKATIASVSASAKLVTVNAAKAEGSSFGNKDNASAERKRDETQRMDQDTRRSVWLEDAMRNELDDNSDNDNEIKRDHLDRFEEYDYQNDDDSDDDSMDEDLVDEELFSESDEPDPDPDPEPEPEPDHEPEPEPDPEVPEPHETQDHHDPQYPPHSHTGGKWRPAVVAPDEAQLNEEEADVEGPQEEPPHHQTQDHPPPNFTGGKWKLQQQSQENLPPNFTGGKWKLQQQSQDHPPPSYTGGKWKLPQQSQQDDPPPSHTGGKWKPPESTVQKNDEYENKDAPGQPPPGHTRGKWVPGARSDIGTGYWCSPCGRKLASRLVYNRHLLSDLHARRSIQEIDGAVQMPRGAAPPLHRQNLSKRQKALAMKKVDEPCEESSADQKKPAARKRQRRREKEVLTCEMCRARVRRAQMGKHLLSHYHCRVAGANPSGSKARRFLLENMANIVRQCPFQCASCRFYCNTEATFLRHWRSDAHKDTVSKIEGSFVCALCDFWCDDNESVEAHIMKQGHQDVVSMINGSVPIVIRRQRVLTCSTCCRRFRYNIQLRFHAKETGHEVDESATDEYQCRLSCNVCGNILRSLIALQRHQLTCHKEGKNGPVVEGTHPYFCSFCSLTFKTAQEAIAHRRLFSHKEMVMIKKSEDGAMDRKCPHCNKQQRTLAEHKRHLLRRHPQLCYSCPKCGERLALPQEVSKHTRENCCGEGSSGVPDAGRRKCPDCQFSNESEAEFLFHRALGACATQEESSAPPRDRYDCPLCAKSFRRKTLRDHLRKHTGERPFPCAKCFTRFARRSTVLLHQKECTGAPVAPGGQLYGGREKKFVCDICKRSFRWKHILRQHMVRHDGKEFKCGLPGCPTILRTEGELRNHRRIVHEPAPKREFHCDDCSYAAKTKTQLIRHRETHMSAEEMERLCQFSCNVPSCNFQTKSSSHLKRHMRMHTGKKPYKCRHCTYASNNLENLRKHVIVTNKHPGMMIYQCESCAYQTNFSKELRAHLLQSHPDKYPTPSDASKYIASIFDDSSDKATCDI